MKKRYSRVVFAFLLFCIMSFMPQNVSAVSYTDYPYNVGPGVYVADAYGFFQCECTSYVAWRLNSTNGISFHNNYKPGTNERLPASLVSGGLTGVWGHAKDWVNAARYCGYAVNNTPAPGAVFCTTSGDTGHVAWVSEVRPGNKAVIEQYNVSGNHAFKSEEYTIGSKGEVYIHIKDIGSSGGGAVHYGACNVDFDTIQHTNISYNNANISAWMRNPSGYSMKSYGFYFGTNPNSMELYTIGANVRWTDAFVSANVEDYVGTLSPGTAYYYRFYSLTDGFQLSGIQSFTTLGSRAISFDSLTNDDGNNRITAWFRNHYPCHINSYGFQIGTSKNNMSDYIVVNRNVEWTDFFVDVTLSDYCSDLLDNQTYYYRFFALTNGFDFSEFGCVTIRKHIHSMTKHSSVSVTCLTDGRSEYYSCSKCNKYYSDAKGNTEIANNSWIIKATGHQHTEIRNKKAATCSEEGYTGDTYCKDCGVKIESGSSTQKQEHTWNKGEITKAPTTRSEGTKTYTCTVCGATKQERVAKLAAEQVAESETNPVLGTVTTIDSKAKALSENADPAGSSFNILQVKGKKVKKTSITLGWKAVPKASGYVIYGAPCGSKYAKLTTTKGTSFTQSKLKKGKYYKYFISAHDKNGNILASSKTIHIATSGGKKGNTKSVKLNKKKKTLIVGRTFKLKATLKNGKLKVSKHRKVAFETDNPKVVTVSKSGKVKAVGKGTCYVYAYAQNGVFAKCKITVK